MVWIANCLMQNGQTKDVQIEAQNYDALFVELNKNTDIARINNVKKSEI